MPRTKGKKNKGQPQGNRSASGRKIDRTPLKVVPSDGVIRRRALYGLPANDVGQATNDRRGRQEHTDTCDAIGRAYNAGLLGSGRRAQDLLLAGRKIAAQYWRHYGAVEPGLTLVPDSLAKWQPRLGGGTPNPERDRIIEDALNDALDLVRAKGRDVRRAFDMLVIDMNPDSGPAWLDAIVWAHKHQRRAAERDYTMLELARAGLEEVA